MGMIEGTHNLNSISIQPSSSVMSGSQDEVQNVTLSQRYLHDDSGNGSSYCSDSLRIDYVTNVTVLSSLLNDEAACYTTNGRPPCSMP
jgi:hypothetical protein